MIDGNDRVRNDKSRTPRFTGGLNVDLGYKDFDLSFCCKVLWGEFSIKRQNRVILPIS